MRKLLTNASSDSPASVVVFLLALPLCPGIALGSGAPLLIKKINSGHNLVYDQSTISDYKVTSAH